MEQSKPVHPLSHLHVPSLKHAPCVSSHGKHSVNVGVSHVSPIQPSLHTHRPSSSAQSPLAHGAHFVKHRGPVHFVPSSSS